MKKYSSTTRANSRHNFKNRHAIIATATGGAVLVFAFLLPSIFGYLGSLVVFPIVKVETWISNSNQAFPSYVRDRSVLLEEKNELQQKLANHAGSELTALRLQEENNELRTLLGADMSTRIAAGVVGRPTTLPYDTFLLDKGASSGIVENAPVFIANDRAIGFVAQVYEDTSLVVLVTTPNLESTVYIYGPNIYTTAVGQGSGSLRVNVPQGIDLTEGDLVVLPSLEAGVYGKISVIDSVPSRPEQYGYVSIDVPLATIRYVSVGNTPLSSITFEDAKEVVESVRTDILTVPVPSGVLVDVLTGTSTATTTEVTNELP